MTMTCFGVVTVIVLSLSVPTMNSLNDRKSRIKSSERVESYKNRRLDASATIQDPLGSGNNWQTLKPLLGDCPPFNKGISWVCDSPEKKAYMIGGRLPGDNSLMPTTDVYCLDLTLMRWKNLTVNLKLDLWFAYGESFSQDSLKFRDLEFPFSSDSCQRKCKRIPELISPGHTLFRIHETSYLLLFGGYDADSEKTSSKLIVIDLRHLEWWYQPVEGGAATGRINPTMVAIDRTRKLFIFGGYRNFEGNGEPHVSYSIASLSNDGRAWSWELVDVHYPDNIPPGTILGRATTIYKGEKILLTPWRTTNDNVSNLLLANSRHSSGLSFSVSTSKRMILFVFISKGENSNSLTLKEISRRKLTGTRLSLCHPCLQTRRLIYILTRLR